MSRIRSVAALSGLLGVIAAVIVALPAQADTPIGAVNLNFEDGSIAPWVANGATVTVVAEPGDESNHVASVTGRGSDTWRGISSATGAFTPGVEYTISARVKLPAGADAQFIANDPTASNQWVWVGHTTVAADTWTTLSGTFTFGDNAANSKVYLEVANTADYLIDDITVTYAPVAVDPCPADSSVLAATGFESGADGWVGRGATAAVSTDDAHTGAQSLAVTGREMNWQGTQLPVTSLFTGGTYTISAWVKLAPGTDPTDMKLTVQGNDGTTDTYAQASTPVSVDADTWVNLCGTYSTVDGDTPSVVYVEAASATASYFVDDVTISTAAVECTPTQTTDSALDFEGGADLGAWQKSGGPTLGVVADPADSTNQVLEVANRQFSYDGIESKDLALAEGTTYTFTAKVRLAEGSSPRSMRLVTKPAYSWGPGATVTADAWTTLTTTVTPTASGWTVYTGSDPGEVDGVSGATFTYLVDDVTVTHLQPCTDGPVPGTVELSADFEDGLQGWVARNSDAGDHTVGVTTEDKHGGAQSALISNRTSQGSGLGFDVAGILEPGVQYELTAWVKFAGTPTANIVFTGQTGPSTFTTLKTFTDITSTGWTQINTKFTIASGDRAFIYFETPWSSSDAIGNTTSFLLDDIEIKVPAAVHIQDLTPIKSTVDFPVGVAIDQRETVGAPSELLLKHFDQITPENFMKPEAWYDANGNWAPNSSQIDPLMTFAKTNNIRVYGHVLVWHSQTPAWFFNKSFADPTPLTNSEEDKQILRERLQTHIHNVAQYLAQWGEFGDDNPLKAFDVVNEVVNDGKGLATNGLRDSRWYQVLGEEYIADAFQYADQEFNHTFAAEGADRPVKLFINDYNTEQSGKRGRYLALIDRLLAAHVPVDGIGHQFHVSLSSPIAGMDDALTEAGTRGLLQAVTEFDAPTGTPESLAKFIDQGYYYRDAFNVFREHADQLFSVTVWGLNDARSWRDKDGGPLIFDDGFQAKQAYYGIVEPAGTEEELPPPLRTANSFAGDVPATTAGVASGDWKLLPLLPAGSHAGFQTRWAADHLSVYVHVTDATSDDTDAVTVQVGDDDYTLPRSGGEAGAVVEHDGGYDAVLHVPLTAAAQGDTIQLDVRVTDGATTTGWNSPTVTGTVTLVEPLSHVDIPEAVVAPEIDGTLDPVWSTSSQVQTLKQVSGTGGAIGTFHLLWKDQTLYVYAQVADPTVDTTGSDPWVQDSVEVFVDGGNAKNGSYRYDDTQIRISADGAVSFGTGDEDYQAARLESSAQRVDGGYVVEAAISLLEYGGLGSLQGLDVQVNDATGGARTAIHNWAEPTGTGYQTTERWGVASLVAGTLIGQDAFTPVVSGAAVVGSALSVTGLPTGGTLSYQWLRNGAVVAGATHSTYTPAAADAGKRFSVRVTNVRAGYADLTVTSAETAAVALAAFTTTTVPTISGSAIVGSTLTAKVSAWSPAASFRYQWLRGGVAIKGATKSTYSLVAADAGKRITVRVVGSAVGYAEVTKTSAQTAAVALRTFVKTTVPTISGKAIVGSKLTAKVSAWSPAASFSYQWLRGGVAIKGATKSTYSLVAADAGKRITVRVVGSASGYAAVTKTSAQTSAVLKTFSKVKAPKISGTAKVGKKLTAKVSAWSPKASFTYQWYSNGKAIKGATKSTFTLKRAQAGTSVTVKVTGSKSGYLSVVKASSSKKVPLLTLTVDRSKLNGPTRVGGTLKVTAGASHPVTTVKSYQWYRGGKAISGATQSTYVAKAADRGKQLTVKVTYGASGYKTTSVLVGPTYRIGAAR